MANLVKKEQFQTSLEKVKTYVDNQANSGVIKTETLLWSNAAGASISDTNYMTTPTKQTVGSYTYNTVWGQNKGFTLSDNVLNYDEIVFKVCLTPFNNSSEAEVYIEIPFSKNDFENDGVKTLGWWTGNIASISDTLSKATFGVGMSANNRLTIAWPYEEANKVFVLAIKGIKYSHPVEYTTSEKVIGTYLGKTLYEKTVAFTQNFSTGQTTLTHNLGLANMVDYVGWYTRKDGTQVPVDSCRYDAGWYAGASDFTANNFRVNIGTSFTNNYQLVKLTMTFRYTKENAR